jgi:hypothetical protein
MRTFLLLLLLSMPVLAGSPRNKRSQAVTGTSATVPSSGGFKAGTVAFYCDVAVYFRVSTTGDEAAVTTDFPLSANTIATVMVDATFKRISLLRQSGNGTCYLWELG